MKADHGKGDAFSESLARINGSRQVDAFEDERRRAVENSGSQGRTGGRVSGRGSVKLDCNERNPAKSIRGTFPGGARDAGVLFEPSPLEHRETMRQDSHWREPSLECQGQASA